MLYICHLVFSFLHPASRLRAQGAAGGSVTKTLHITINLLFRHRNQTVPGTAVLPGLDLLEVRIRGGHSPEGSHITPWGAAALCVLCTAPGHNNPCPGAWGMLPLCFLMCAPSLGRQETDLPFSRLPKSSAPLPRCETWGGVMAWG